MTDDEIRALRDAYRKSRDFRVGAEELCVLADEALRRGEEIAQLEQNASIRGAYAYARRDASSRVVGVALQAPAAAGR